MLNNGVAQRVTLFDHDVAAQIKLAGLFVKRKAVVMALNKTTLFDIRHDPAQVWVDRAGIEAECLDDTVLNHADDTIRIGRFVDFPEEQSRAARVLHQCAILPHGAGALRQAGTFPLTDEIRKNDDIHGTLIPWGLATESASIVVEDTDVIENDTRKATDPSHLITPQRWQLSRSITSRTPRGIRPSGQRDNFDFKTVGRAIHA